MPRDAAARNDVVAVPVRLAIFVALLAGLIAGPWAKEAPAAPRAACLGHKATIVSSAQRVRGTSGADVIVSRRRSGATVHGRGGDDWICGSSGRDRLLGAGGDDRLSGGAGRDRLIGAAGQDAFRVTRGDRTDAVAGEKVNGKARSVMRKLRKTTVELAGRDIVSVGDAAPGQQRQVLVLGARSPLPRPGTVISAPASRAAPSGVLGRVVAARRSSGRRVRVELRPASLTEAYSDYSVSSSGDLGDVTAGSKARASGLTAKFDCTSGAGPTVEADLDLSDLHYIVEMQTLSPYIEVFLTGPIHFDMAFDFHGAVTCTAQRTRPVKIPIPGTALTLNVRPEFSFTADAALKATAGWTARVSYGFIRSLRQGNSDFRVFRGESRGSDFTGAGSLEAFLGVNLELALAGRIGVGGTVGPVLEGVAQAFPESCFSVRAAFRGELTASADVFFKDWVFSLATVTFGSFELFRRCLGGGGPGGGGSGGGGSGGGDPGDPGGGGSGGGEPPPDDTTAYHSSAEGPYTGSRPAPTRGESPQISVGRDNGCALTPEGAARCFGEFYFGYAGDPAGRFSQVSVGMSGACAVRLDAGLLCWDDRDHPIKPPSGRFTSVSLGLAHACAVDVEHILTCWGKDESGETRPHPGRYTQVSAGEFYTCAIRVDGRVACWGKGWWETQPLTTPPTGVFRQISVGSDQTCALREIGSVTCWDVNNDRTETHGGPYTSVDVGHGLACAHKPDGALDCFPPTGSGNPQLISSSRAGTYPQVGIGFIGACGRAADGSVTCWSGMYRGQVAPAAGPFRSLMAGNYFTCGLRSDSTLACWGSRDGEAPNPLPGRFLAASGGGAMESHSICGIRLDRTLLCQGGRVPLSGTYSTLAVTNSTGCAVARATGRVRCWTNGGNTPVPDPPSGSFTQLTVQSFDGGFSPQYCGLRTDRTLACWNEETDTVFVDPPAGEFTKVSTGYISACAIRTDQTLTCWTPGTWHGVGEPPQGAFKDVAVGTYFACGLRTDGTIACWGDDDFGERSAPAGTFVSIVAGQHHACARRSDGSIACWGNGRVLP